ncbi:hypothetical protein SDC9_04126 [bioreactor metagenome]|uniref:Holin n=1 Tax=bioreactor metagenome TaxID=1076179 RepID=A0A644SY11_9ZZZZ
MSVGAVAGAWFGTAIGGIDQQVISLAILSGLDYLTGMYAAWKNKNISSRIGFKGMMKKVAIFGAIILANQFDTAAGLHLLRPAVFLGFAIVELSSLLENIDRIGWGEYIPSFLRDKLVQIREEKGVKL